MMFARRRNNAPLMYVIALAAVLGVLWWGFGFLQRQDEGGDEKDAQRDFFIDERGEVPPPGEQEALEPGGEAEDVRTEVIDAVEARTSPDLLPGALGTGGAIERFWFASDREVYVEYRRSGSGIADRMAFLTAAGSGGGLALERKSLYGLGDATWELIEGEEALFVKPQRDLYERDASGQWVKRN